MTNEITVEMLDRTIQWCEQNAFWGNSHIPVFIHNLVKKTQMHGYDQAILSNRQRNVMGLALYRA